MNTSSKIIYFVKYLVIGGLIGSIILIASAALFVKINYKNSFIEQKNCAVVLGAAVWRDDIPSHALLDRTLSGINLYKKKNVTCLIFSGGKSLYGSHEADVMNKIAREKNIPASDIYIDYHGNNTKATVANAYTIFPDTSFVFVSNDFHLGRIKLIAWKTGVENFSVHAATYHNGKYIKKNYFFWREVAGLLYYLFMI